MSNMNLHRTVCGLLAGTLFLAFLTSCNNSDEVGLNLTAPGERFRYVIDSSAVVTATTLRQDSLTSEKRSASLLGCMNDPVFGRSIAHLLSQFRLTSNEVEFSETAVIDSTVLLLKNLSWYGDTTTPQPLRVYELTQDLFFDSTYYSNLDITGFYDESSPIADISYTPRPSQDSLLIRLSDTFGQKILDADTSYLSNNTTWLTFFRGLFIEALPVEQGGSIISYNFTGGESRFTLYYHDDENDSLSYEVIINSNCTWINLFQHDYSGASVSGWVNDSLYDHPEVYMQGMSGTRAHIRLELPESILSMVETGVAINKAEIIFTLADDPTSTQFATPKTLRIFNARADGMNQYIDDLSLGEAYYGGTLDADAGTYTFNIGCHVQSLVHPDSAQRVVNRGMFLVLSEERTSAGRLLLKNDPGSMKLRITYTPLK